MTVDELRKILDDFSKKGHGAKSVIVPQYEGFWKINSLRLRFFHEDEDFAIAMSSVVADNG